MGKICQVIVSGIRDEKKIIDVANSEDEFNKTTILAFKEKLLVKYPEIRGDSLRILFTTTPLQDNDTFAMHNIKHLSTLFVVIKLPGGAAHTAG
ncbi:hypothetical protein QTP70_011366 [Hemibagrus guttatus]|uniref:Ubiquitin-like domain-containing protein n=1 Tax=Hemibagrus guttatus TaxID=175788 RepID=A0AAE0VAX5_9TELE|nr:hypothetical protein QTP70_011366 [Hemibagrus guttatus]KAK3567075.1 hypothetical protein QTP86_009774 [Hemibagrus guttatus]